IRSQFDGLKSGFVRAFFRHLCANSGYQPCDGFDRPEPPPPRRLQPFGPRSPRSEPVVEPGRYGRPESCPSGTTCSARERDRLIADASIASVRALLETVADKSPTRSRACMPDRRVNRPTCAFRKAIDNCEGASEKLWRVERLASSEIAGRARSRSGATS